ncbi:hypothetical protein SELMODRAFT_424503 [Selaginella moellendorffii]|uniref:Uncharacterized protein n=1 Tax=Selaginella moellendorffii TaxID=88036 RepID=D8SQ38_SELML|nr:hypothetical protein SELMODRAFT_424503 [Selaginella moellendorffii]
MSGRHKQDAALFEEMRQLAVAPKPDLIVFVMDGSSSCVQGECPSWRCYHHDLKGLMDKIKNTVMSDESELMEKFAKGTISFKFLCDQLENISSMGSLSERESSNLFESQIHRIAKGSKRNIGEVKQMVDQVKLFSKHNKKDGMLNNENRLH